MVFRRMCEISNPQHLTISQILDWLGIDEARRDRPPPKRLAATDLFDDFSQDDYINCNYSDF